MIRRLSALLGLLAFFVVATGGLMGGNSFEFTLSRALQAMFLFVGIGLVVGWAAQCVVREHYAKQKVAESIQTAAPIQKEEQASEINSTAA